MTKSLPIRSPGTLFLLGGAAIPFGLMTISLPGAAAVAMAFWVGLLALIWGIALTAAGFMARKGNTEEKAPAKESAV